MYRKTLFFALLLSLILAVTGCGTKQSSPLAGSVGQKISKSGQNTIAPGDKEKYSGAANYKKFQDLAAQNPKDPNAQISAGMSAFSNKDYTKAIQYYKQAIAVDPQNGIAYNNIGNVYLRGLNEPKTALQYYVKATEIQPSYDYGWLNLALCQKALGDTSGEKATIDKGMKVLGKEDQLYTSLLQLKSQLK